MKNIGLIIYALPAAILLTITACAGPASSSPAGVETVSTPAARDSAAYDTTKQYVAFVVADTPAARKALDGTKTRAAQESYEIGPIVYYAPGTTDFGPVASQLIASKQVKLVWFIGTANDINPVKSALSRLAYQGAFRYAVIIQGILNRNAWTGA